MSTALGIGAAIRARRRRKAAYPVFFDPKRRARWSRWRGKWETASDDAARALNPELLALLFRRYRPGPVPAHPQLATEYRYAVAQTQAAQRNARILLSLWALDVAAISLLFLAPFPLNLCAWAGTSYGITRVGRRCKLSHFEQVAFLESTYRLGGFGPVGDDWTGVYSRAAAQWGAQLARTGITVAEFQSRVRSISGWKAWRG